MLLKIQISLIIILLIIINNQSISDDNFTKYFKKVKSIQLSSEDIIGEIAYLDVDKKGNLLITDQIGNKVLIFSPVGKLKSKLSPEPCHPGFTFNPLKAKYSTKETIFLTNAIPWGYRFKNNGECLGKVDKTFTPPLEFTFDNEGNIYGYYQGHKGNYLCKMDSTGKEIARFGEFPKSFKNLLFRLEGGGIVCDSNGYIYNVNPVEPKIYKYNKKLELIAIYKREPPYYKAVREDLPSGLAPYEMTNKFKKIIVGKTLTYSLHLLDNDKILVQYITKKEIGVDVFDLNGKLLTADIISPEIIMCAKYGKIYLVRELDFDDLNNIPNPIIDVYQYIFD